MKGNKWAELAGTRRKKWETSDTAGHRSPAGTDIEVVVEVVYHIRTLRSHSCSPRVRMPYEPQPFDSQLK
jgi:hypothetical protein